MRGTEGECRHYKLSDTRVLRALRALKALKALIRRDTAVKADYTLAAAANL